MSEADRKYLNILDDIVKYGDSKQTELEQALNALLTNT